tara:strand:- start:284 stop:628 length:345 start_codon:yes stop_codon:yes gene_type:complete
MHLNFENRIRLNKEAGGLVHSFGEGYYIVDENGEWVNTFSDEERFNQLIDKFRYRYFLLEKLNNAHSVNFDFGEDNILIINNNIIKHSYWGLPKNDDDVDLYFKVISEEFIQKS